MRRLSTLLMMTTYALCLPCARAQVLNFTNDFSHARGEHEDPALRKAQPDLARFPAGSAVWAVLNPTTAGYTDINEFSGSPKGGGALRQTLEMANNSGGWNLVSSELVPVPANLGTGKDIVILVIPNKPRDTQPFNQLLDMIAAHKGTDPILLRLKVENGGDSSIFSQSGFYLDVSQGLGRYGEWIAQRTAAANAVTAAFEQQHLQPRSAFVKDYRSLKTDPKFVTDVAKWWKDNGGGSKLLSAKVCSANYIIMRDNLGIVTEKQLCALITYKRDNQCFAQIRRFSYPRIGRDTFENDLVDATYANQSLPADDGEAFSGATEYQIDCSATR